MFFVTMHPRNASYQSIVLTCVPKGMLHIKVLYRSAEYSISRCCIDLLNTSYQGTYRSAENIISRCCTDLYNAPYKCFISRRVSIFFKLTISKNKRYICIVVWTNYFFQSQNVFKTFFNLKE